MTGYVLTANCNIDQLGDLSPSGSATARTGGDTIDTNGFAFTIDQDSRYGLKGLTAGTFGNMVVNSSKGGSILIDGRNVRLIPYDTGSGNVPAYNTTISIGGASGKLIAVYDTITSTPTAEGAAMPADGYIKVKAWNGTAYAAGALTGIGASATAADVAGWIEVVGDDTATFTANRLGTISIQGAWYEFLGVTTDGVRATTYQIPTNGSVNYVSGVWVQTASVSITAATYAAGFITYTAAAHGFNIAQDVTITGATSGYNCADSPIVSQTTNTFTVAASDPAGSWASGGSAYIYEFYPTAGARTALIANFRTDAVRGAFCWISSAGLIRFGHDGTNSTGGYVVPSGRKLRIPNVLLQNSSSANRTINLAPTTTLATRYEFVTTGGGVVNINKACCNWYFNSVQAYSLSVKYMSVFEALLIQETASPITIQDVGIGHGPASTSINAFTLSLMFAGGTIRNCTMVRYSLASSGFYAEVWADIANLTVSNHKTMSLTKAGNLTSGAASMSRLIGCTFTNCKSIGAGKYLLIGCDTVSFFNTGYVDNTASTTTAAIPVYAWDLGSAASYNIKLDGLHFMGLALVQPYAGILNISVAGCKNIYLRNLGTAAAPLDLGGPFVSATWTRATNTITVTSTAHGMEAIGPSLDIMMCSDSSSLPSGGLTTSNSTLRTITSITDANVFVFTGTAVGQTTGQNLLYAPCMCSALVNFVAGAAINGLYVQRCYVPHLRTAILVGIDNSCKNVYVENVWTTDWAAQTSPQLNGHMRQIMGAMAVTAQASTYGTHFVDSFIREPKGPQSAASWSRTTTVCTVTASAHRLRVGDQVLVTVTSDSAAVILGVKTLTQITGVASPVNVGDTFQFTCLNAGGASGTLSYTPLNGRIAIHMNEPTTETASQVQLSGGAAFTSAGTLYMPTIGQYAIFTSDLNIKGHGSFPNAVPVMGTGTIGNYDITYSLDNGATYKNLYYPRAGGGGASASTNVTMTSTTGVAVDDYVFGTNIAPMAKVTSITNSTTVVVNIANTGVVSGVLNFAHLPSETISASTGTPFKVKILTSTTNTTAIASLYVVTNSNATDRESTYPLDVVPVTITVRDADSLAAIQNARVRITTVTGGYVVLEGVTNASGIVTGTTEYANHEITGTVRRATVADGTRYKAGSISGTTTSAGFSATVLLTSDE